MYHTAARVRSEIVRVLEQKPDYDHDGMRLYGKSLDFLRDPRFTAAYAAGMNTEHHICRPKGSTEDIHNEYRVYMCCWAASHAARLPGDFVECGVNTGITSVAICTFLNFNETKKRFFLFDTYQGIPLEQATEAERVARAEENERYYEECFDVAKRNFAPWPNCILVRGRIPETLQNDHQIERIAYMHLDMNIAAPEIAAIEHFWPRMVTGGIIMLDDDGYEQYRPQKTAMDNFARKAGVLVATLPTGQGMILKS
jgi:O-methyltransferase